MLNIPRRLRKRLLHTAIIGLVFVSISYIVLPPDSSIRLALRFNAARASAAVREVTEDRDAWLRQPAAYEVDLREDVGYLIKTGYGTRHRVPLQLAALQGSYGGGLLGKEGKDYLVVGDWTTVDGKDGKAIGVPVHDVLKTVREYGDGDWRAHHRFKKYQTLQSAIVAGDEETALEIGRSVGWELDALKVRCQLDDCTLKYLLTRCSLRRAWSSCIRRCPTKSGISFWTTTHLWSNRR